MGRDANSCVSDASSRRGRPEAVLDWHSLQSTVDGAIDERRRRLQVCVDEKEHFEQWL